MSRFAISLQVRDLVAIFPWINNSSHALLCQGFDFYYHCFLQKGEDSYSYWSGQHYISKSHDPSNKRFNGQDDLIEDPPHCQMGRISINFHHNIIGFTRSTMQQCHMLLVLFYPPICRQYLLLIFDCIR